MGYSTSGIGGHVLHHTFSPKSSRMRGRIRVYNIFWGPQLSI